ncbi:MAG: diguanylate cyclase [Steroidobacteraceae bacterium]
MLLLVAGAAPGWTATDAATELLARAQSEVRTDPEAVHRDTLRALELLSRKPVPDQQIEARLLLCDYFSERDTRQAGEQLKEATELLPKAKRQGLEAGILLCNGSILEADGQNALALAHYDQAVQVATSNNETKLLADALFSRGYLLGLSGRYPAALADLRRSQQLFESLNLSQHAVTVLNCIAIQYNRMGDFAQARDIYERALQAQRSAGMKREQAVTLYNLGRAQENLQNWAASRLAYTEGRQISHDLNYARGEAYALRGLAAIANAAGNPDEALQLTERAAQLQKAAPDERLRAQILRERATALHRLGRRAEAVTALQDSIDVFRKAEAQVELAPALGELGELQAELNNFHAAYDSTAEAKRISDQLLKNQLDQRFALLKVEFDSVTKDKENALLRSENAAGQAALQAARRSRQMQGTIIGLSVALLVALVLLVLHLRRSAHRMGRLAMTDELTGVANRRAVLANLEKLLDEPEQRVALVIIDIDHFKRINDRHGHHAGDAALRIVARLLRTLPPPAQVGRLGGEEFIVMLPGSDLGKAQAVAENLRASIMELDASHWFSDQHITASFGVTITLPAMDSPSQMLRRADNALYAAKHAGRNCVRVELGTGIDLAAAADRGSDEHSPGAASLAPVVQ